MGYNKEDYKKIKEEYETKYIEARAAADRRAAELRDKLPEVREIDAVLGGTGKELMAIIFSGAQDAEAKTLALKDRNNKLLARRAEVLCAAGYPEDYSDIKYECEKCSDSGYADNKMCECMRRRLVLAGYESSGIGELIKTQSFENFCLDFYREGGNYEHMQLFYNGLRRFATEFNSETYKNFLLFGGTGLGKTHMSTSVAKEVIDKGYDVLYVSAVGMIRDFETKRFGNGDTAADRTDRYFGCDLLIIDDLGTEMVNQFTLSCIYDVINSRINARKCTIINTNLNQKEIETKYSERITSRLFGEYSPIPFKGVDIRRQKLMKK